MSVETPARGGLPLQGVLFRRHYKSVHTEMNRTVSLVISNPELFDKLYDQNGSRLKGEMWTHLEAIGQGHFSRSLGDRLHELLEERLRSADPLALAREGFPDFMAVLPLLNSSRLVEQAQGLGAIQRTGPEFAFPDPLVQELYLIDRTKIAMRSMEHAQPGRAFNDFRAQVAVLPPTLDTLLMSDLPPRTKSVLMVLYGYANLFFDAFHLAIERPYIFLSTDSQGDPDDFSEGVTLFQDLMPFLDIQEQCITGMLASLRPDMGSDLDAEQTRALTEMMLGGLGAICARYNMLGLQDKFNPVFMMYSMRDNLPELIDKINGFLPDAGERDFLFRQIARTARFMEETYRQRVNSEEYAEKRAGNPNYFPLEEVVEGFEASRQSVENPPPAEPSEAPAEFADVDLAIELLTEPLNKIRLAKEIAIDRIQFARGRMEMDRINLTHIIGSLPAQVLPSPGEETLGIDAPEHYDLFVVGNERRIRGALSNIISNAFHYAKELYVTLLYHEKEQAAEIILRDTGKGVTPELLEEGVIPGRPCIFDLGITRREHDSATKKKGTGVGTTESWLVFNMHDGSLNLSSVREPAENHGTTFCATLPATRGFRNRERMRFDTLIEQVGERFGVGHRLVLEEAKSYFWRKRHIKASEMRFILYEEEDACPFNQDYLYRESSVGLSGKLFESADHAVITTILRDFLLPFEFDRVQPQLNTNLDGLVQHTALLVRSIKRFARMPAERQIALLDCLRTCDLANRNALGLASLLETASRDEDNLARTIAAALRYAASSQVRSLFLRDTLAIERDAAALLEKLGPVPIEVAFSKAWRRERMGKFREVVHAFGVSRNVPFYQVMKDSFASESSAWLGRRKTEGTEFPTDSYGLLMYLIEHGLLARVVQHILLDDLRKWKETADRVLPYAASFIESDLFIQLFQSDHADSAMRKNLSDVVQLPFLGPRRMEDIERFLSQFPIEPITSEEREARRAAKVLPWFPLLELAFRAFTETGLDDIIYEETGLGEETEAAPEEPEAAEVSLDSATVFGQLLQYRYLQSPYEARQVFSDACKIIERYAARKDVLERLNREAIGSIARDLRDYLNSEASESTHPLYDSVTRLTVEELANRLKGWE
ncbi:MAG: ATP-binding protein [Armatimonadetes bacterium]|nr:ATP-binding protein [Armatimonadota bacterium]